MDMNRKQRRASGVKNTEKVYTLTESQLSKIILDRIKTDPEIRKVIKGEVRRVQKLESSNLDALILKTLNDVFGFGKKRLLQYTDGLMELQNYYNDRYDDCAMFAVKQHLKERIGIDVDELQKEVEEKCQKDCRK